MKKKILHIIVKTGYDGVNAYSTSLIKNLPGYYHQLLFCYKCPTPSEIVELNIPCHYLIDNCNISNWSIIGKYIRAILFFRKSRFDVIHYHQAGVGVLLIAVLLKKRAKVIHHLHGGNLIGDSTKQDISVIHRLILNYLSKHTLQIAVADHVVNEYKQKIKNTGNILIIKNTVPFEFISRKNKNSCIGYIGRSELTKGYFLFSEVSLSIKLNHPNICFLMMVDNLKNEVPHIEQIPSSFQTNKFYEKIDLLIFTSDATEGLPLVLLEALAFDVAVIARPLKGVVEILGEDYPLYFKNNEEIKSKVEYFYSDIYNRDSLSNLHQERLKEFSYDEMLGKIDLLYKST